MFGDKRKETVSKIHNCFYKWKEEDTLQLTFQWSEMPNPDPLYESNF